MKCFRVENTSGVNNMMNLYHGNTPTKNNIIYDNIINWNDFCKKMYEYLNKINFKSYYQRIWEVDGYMYIDYGNHTNYFIIDNKIKDNK